MMNVPLSQWPAPKVSRLWSAKGDDRCSPPRSDDYKDWTLMQLKREITQRQLKTNPRRRNKEAFVRVLLANDQEQAQAQTQSAPQNQQHTLEESVMFVPTSSSELQNIYVNNGDRQQEIYGVNTSHQPSQQEVYATNGGQQQQHQQDVYGNNTPQQPPPSNLYNGGQQRQDMYMEQHQQQEVYTNPGEQPPSFMAGNVNVVMQSASLEPTTPVPQMQTPMAVAPETLETEVEAPQSFEASKRQRVEQTEHESEGSGNASDSRRSTPSVQQIQRGSTEYLRRKLSIQAARLEIESRRLDIDTKREQRNSELHAVQLALASEQLQHAKLTTQKMKNEWMVEQMIQKKRLNDAGISHEDSAALGMYMS
ncbi:hypothetical protein PInf_019861 [Phytophthora infestans]|nr:hypothetical protein PInf_019861 [Phytophthora infestans]